MYQILQTYLNWKNLMGSNGLKQVHTTTQNILSRRGVRSLSLVICFNKFF